MVDLSSDARVALIAFAVVIVIMAIVGYVGYEHWWTERYD